MSTQQAAEPPILRLSWPAIGACLVAFGALFLTESGSMALPVLAVALVLTRVVSYRFGDTLQEYGPAAAAGIVLVLVNSVFHQMPEGSTLFDPRRLGLFGELCAVGLVVEAWRRHPHAGGRGVIVILLSGLVMFAAANTVDDTYTRYLVPAYVLLLAVSLRGFVSPSEPRLRHGEPTFVHTWRAGALVLALALGVAEYLAFHTYRGELTQWGMDVLGEHIRVVPQGTGVSRDPMLGAGYGLEGGLDRVLRLAGGGEGEHLRGLSFSTYSQRRWGPSRDSRKMATADPGTLRGAGTAAAAEVRVTRLVDADGILFAPLSAAGIDIPVADNVDWAPEEGGPLRTDAPAPSGYGYLPARGPDAQGPLCVPPTAGERAVLLRVPPEVDGRVAELAQRVVGAVTAPEGRARAIESYLMAHHGYSLHFDPGSGEPVSSFVLGSRPAHCEYFAAAAAIMLRCAGVPARYVVGYYAHESAGDGTVVVRQRDAHAWAEAWIDGKGWITVDATPADGRPDRTGGPPPWTTRLVEWLQDRWQAVVSGAYRLPVVGALGGLLVLASLLRLRGRRPRGAARAAELAYSQPSAELAALRARFEGLCRQWGLAVPPGRTWREALVEGGRPGDGVPGGWAGAGAFVARYNAARFGAAGQEDVAGLAALLDEIERAWAVRQKEAEAERKG